MKPICAGSILAVAGLLSLQLAPAPLTAQAPRSPTDSVSEAKSTSASGAIVLASLGSIVGLHAGALVGYQMGGAREDYMGPLVRMTLGAVLGATAGATIVTHNRGWALFGSVAGTIFGFIVAPQLQGPVGEGAALVTFSIIHGVVTGLVASR